MYPKRETTSARFKTHRVWQRTHSWWCTGWALHATSQVTDLIDKNDVPPVRKRQSFTTGTKNKKAFVALDEKLGALVLRKPAATSYQKADWCPRTLSFSFLTITGLQRLTVWTTDGIWRGEPNGVWYTKGGKECLDHGSALFHGALCQLTGVLSFMQHVYYLHFTPAHRSQYKNP